MIVNGYEIKPKADLSGADLSGADLLGTDISGADLRKANLSGADLRKANLSEADFRKAHLSGADLRGTNLSGADLRKANLSEADFRWANLREADFRWANITNARIDEPIARLEFGCWSICSGSEQTSIGYTTKRNELWLASTPESVAWMDKRAAEWWSVHGEAVKAVIRCVISKRQV